MKEQQKSFETLKQKHNMYGLFYFLLTCHIDLVSYIILYYIIFTVCILLYY